MRVYIMTLVLSPKKARYLEALLNMSAVKGSPMDPDCMSADDMALENLLGKGYDVDPNEYVAVIQEIWETLDKRVNR